ncbi:hypothetical protein H072_7657 [Dactylellina haptotyla CBS 200.50]|uniref:Uncharacterized protein n=1 Tax=Dactylellina haptotyla (strain CBS 200.50) TaxID=1284197 RepID=S8A6C3_DACHA|nr:hypothetical protein H072_7657 [Dactylellina haptotyla CBS 200.50]
MSLASVRKTVFNPLLQTKEDVAAYLKSLPNPNGTAHPFNKTLLLLENDKIEEIDISDKSEDYFFSATDLNTLSETITQRIELFSGNLEKFKAYQIISLVNPYLEVPFVAGESTIVVLSVRDPTFYDFCLGNANGNMVLFSNTTDASLPGFRHSGDISQGNNLLHHAIFDDDMNEEPFTLFVSGYSNNALHRYKPQSPAVTICDHEAKIMYVVPVPLDQATIGEATLCAPVVGRRRGNKLCFSVLPSAVTSQQVAGGSRLAGDTLARAIAREPPPPAPTQVGLTSAPDAKPAKKKTKSDEAKETLTIVEVDTAKPLFVTEEGCKFPEIAKGKDGNHITFFQGITVHSEQPEDVEAEDKVVLPCALGNALEGSMILALGKPFTGAKVSQEQYTRLFDKAPLVVFTVSDRMSDQARVLNPDLRCNALYILQTTTPIPDQSTASVEDMLNEVKINAITALSGPQSIVVIQLGDRYYFYRGIRWPGLFEEIPKFAEDITEAIEAIFESQEAPKHPWNNIVSVGGDPTVYFKNAISTPDELYTNFTSLGLDELENFKPEILDTLSQLQVAMSPKDLPVFTSKLQNSLKRIIDDLVAPLKKEYVDALLASKGKTRDPKLMEKYRRAEKQAKVAVQWLIDALGGLVSTRISSTRQYDLKQMIRKQKIMDNVAASKDMTYDSLALLLEEHCTEIGMVIANIESTQFRTLLEKVSDSNLLRHIQQLPRETGRICALDNRVQYLSGLDSGIILPLSQDGHTGPLAMQKGQLALSFPYGVSDDTTGSAFAFACFDQFINIKHPYSQFWVELCNLHHVSMFRILQRNTITSAIQSREFSITPANKDLGFMLAYCLTDAMKSLAATRAGIPQEAKFGEDVDTTTKMMRGLFGYLMTSLAAGVQPMSMAWQMLSKSTTIEAPPQDEFWLYGRIIELFPYTAWPQAQFKKNVRLLVARLIRRQIADPVTKPLRDSMAQMKQDEFRDYIKKRNVHLKWVEVTVEVLSKLLLGGYAGEENRDKVKGIAQRLVDLVPPEELTVSKGKRGLIRVMKAFKKLKETGEIEAVDLDTRQAAGHTYAKRSAAMKELKEKLVEAASEKKVAETKKAYDDIQAKMREIASRFKVESVKVQNHKNIDEVVSKLEKGEELELKRILALLKSDAEIYREPWRVGKFEEPEPSKMHLVHFILTEEMIGPDEAKSKEVIIEEPKTLDQRLSALPGGDKAGKLAIVMEKVKETAELIKIANLPEDDFMAMFKFCNGNTEEEVETLKKSIVVYLEGWSDVVAAEGRVMDLLRGPKGKAEDKEIAEVDAKAAASAK